MVTVTVQQVCAVISAAMLRFTQLVPDNGVSFAPTYRQLALLYFAVVH